MDIRSTTASDVKDILRIHERAFGHDSEARLVEALLRDPSAEPRLSLLALDGACPVGHILFTRVRLSEPDNAIASAIAGAILAPLAVVPEAQKQGIGDGLITAGLDILTKSGTGLVFVLGHPGYYPRHGFAPAGQHGLLAPYPIPPEHADAWMVLALKPGLIGTVHGTVACCAELGRPELWRE